MRFQLSELLPKDKPTDPDIWRRKAYEVIDPLPTWEWRHGVPVCVACKADRSGWRDEVLHTLRADKETCSCNCDSRPMKEVF